MNITQFGKKAADKLATATNNGLLAAADYVKLQALHWGGSDNNRLLLPPDYTSFVAEESGGGDAHLRSPNRDVFLEAKANQNYAVNAYYDGTNWNRFDVAQPAWCLSLLAGTTFLLRTVAAGANPIVWTTVGSFTPNTLGLVMDPPRVQTRGGSVSPGSGVETNMPAPTNIDLNTGGVLGGTPYASGGGFTVPVAGLYQFFFSGWFVANGGGTRRYAALKHSGIGLFAVQSAIASATATHNFSVSAQLSCAAGAVVTPVMYQDSGINIAWTTYTFGARYLGVS